VSGRKRDATHAPSKQRYGWCVSPIGSDSVLTIDRARELAAELLAVANEAEMLNAASSGTTLHEVDCFLFDGTPGDDYVLIECTIVATGATVRSVHEVDAANPHHQPGQNWGDRKRNPRYVYTALAFVTPVTTHETQAWQTVRFMQVDDLSAPTPTAGTPAGVRSTEGNK
jgi:hypothetical protein